jgi:malate dehydrogenase (oxaloacetate-decarboxylating)
MDPLKQHKQLGGKIAISLKDNLDSVEKLSTYYTPGVGKVSSYVAKHPDEAGDYTWLNNNVAIVSDGTAVLGLGNLCPYGALPVMEGKAMLFKHFANVDAVPIVLDVHTADEIVDTVKAIAPSFGGINLEDIAAPTCFEVEERLKAELKIPVMHDDQHGTAIVVLAALLNACKVTGRELRYSNVIIIGAGAAGVAIAKLLRGYVDRLAVDGQGTGPSMFAFDTQGIIHHDRHNLNESKKRLLKYANLSNSKDSLQEIARGADVIIGVSGPGTITPEIIKVMAKDPIIFALANPTPEIMPNEAKKAGAAIVATGRSDFPNQVNNALVFPGIFRGALDHKVRMITDDHKIAVAEVLAGLVKEPTADSIIPPISQPGLVDAVAKVIV